MSFQAQPQQQQQQPAQVYPTSVTNQPPSDHSNGSFGAVFIVLAVIIVISAIACFLGRLCNRHTQSHTPGPGPTHSQKPVNQQKQNQNQTHLFRRREGDVELGLDKRMPSLKSNGFRVGNGHGLGGRESTSRGPTSKPPINGGGSDMMKGFEMKIGDRGNLTAIA